MSNSAALPRRLLRYAARRLARRRFQRQLAATRPIAVPRVADIELHMVCGAKGAAEAIAAAKSFLRYKSDIAVVVHEDGSFRDADVRRLQHHLPGVQLIERERAEAEMLPLLRSGGYARCADLRARHTLTLKIFDIQYYARDKRVLYFDSDILFLAEPRFLIDAITAPVLNECYNEDVREFYAWPRPRLREHMGFDILPRVNSGLFAIQRAEPHWQELEHCLALPVSRENYWYVEQTLIAVDLSLSAAQPLPLDYDVCFRHAWRADWDREFARAGSAEGAVSEHYCGGEHLRRFFYRDFERHLAAVLQ